MTWVPERQRREGRPTAALLLVFVLMLLPMGGCGAMGTLKLLTTRRPVVHVSNAAELEKLPAGTYVALDLQARREHFSDGDQEPASVVGYGVYRVTDAPRVVLFSETALPANAHVAGQLCAQSAGFACSLPEPALAFTQALQQREKVLHQPVTALVNGAAPSDARAEAAIGLGIATMCLAVFVLVAAFLIRAGNKPGVVVFTRTLMLAHAPEHVRAALRAQAGPLCRVAEDSPARMCMLLGRPVGKVRMWGARTPETIPLRVDLELETDAANAYRGAMATVTVRELIPPPAKLQLLTGPRTTAIDRAAGWILSLC